MFVRAEIKQAIFDNNIPALGICCGQNVMVRALGGTTKLVANQKKQLFV